MIQFDLPPVVPADPSANASDLLADRVALLQDGRITAVGTHSDLLRRSDAYRHVISSLEEAEAEREAQTGAIPVIRTGPDTAASADEPLPAKEATR